MFDVLLCVQQQHNYWFVLLAATICLISTTSAVQFLRHARHLSGNGAGRWIAGAGIAIGFGIWATHFVAMLGYDTGVVAGYKGPATVISLAVAIALTTMSFSTVVASASRKNLIIASLLAGGGISAMHYIGMQALELPARLTWRTGYVVASVLFAVLPMYPALSLAIRRRSPTSGAAAGLFMTLSIVLLHFTGMTALTLVPAPLDERTGILLSRDSMAGMIGAGSLMLLTICIVVLNMARRTRITVSATEREMSILVKGITDCAIYMLDRNGNVANWNAGAERLKGYTAEQAIGLPLSAFYPQADRLEGAPARALSVAREVGKFGGEGWRMRRGGTLFWAHVLIEKISDEDGRHIGFAKITRDMSRFKEDQDRLRMATEQLDAALGNMHQGLCLFGPDERLALVNPRFTEIWGIDLDARLLGMTVDKVARSALSVLTFPDIPQNRIEDLREVFASTQRDASGVPLTLEVTDGLIVSMVSRAMPGGGWVTTIEDVTERRRTDAKIAHMAMHDSLTGLPNRSHFARWIDSELDQARHFGHQLTSVMIDLDRFKEINDTRGHGAGDTALQHLSRRLLEVLSEGEIVARLGGDEFAAAKRFRDKADLTSFLDRLEGCFASPFGPEDNSYYLGASIGVAVFPQDGDEREQLLNNADLAMYRAKANVSERIAYYEPEMDETARARRLIANELRQALDRKEMWLVYQPQHDIATGETTGYEALLRWDHPTHGRIAPDDFIPIAEETGEIFRIGEWVLRHACAAAVDWADDLKVAVNLSAVQLSQNDLVDLVRSILVETGLSPRRLELEITETAIISDKQRALHVLRQIKGLGVSIAIDDFGTGYSSLDTLHSFPFDKIKIDKSFLSRSRTSPQARAIIKAVLALGQSLQVPVLAEGVETVDQLDLLKEHGCDEAQGYYFGRPGAAPGSNEPPAELERAALP